jgi:hypothetical protein
MDHGCGPSGTWEEKEQEDKWLPAAGECGSGGSGVNAEGRMGSCAGINAGLSCVVGRDCSGSTGKPEGEPGGGTTGIGSVTTIAADRPTITTALEAGCGICVLCKVPVDGEVILSAM